jgi:predicted Ser/Thr protein kinase
MIILLIILFSDVTYYFDQSGLLGKGGFGLVYAGYGIKGNEKIPVRICHN